MSAISNELGLKIDNGDLFDVEICVQSGVKDTGREGTETWKTHALFHNYIYFKLKRKQGQNNEDLPTNASHKVQKSWLGWYESQSWAHSTTVQ